MPNPLPVTTKQGKEKFKGKLKEIDGTGFVGIPSDHDLFVLHIDGIKQLAVAKFSRASRGRNSYVHSQTPKQLGIKRRFCVDLIQCKHTLKEYLDEWDINLVKATLNIPL